MSEIGICLALGAWVIGISPKRGAMGRKARLRKAAEIEQRQQEKVIIEGRKKAARLPIVILAVRVFVVLVVTLGVLYVGKIINDKIVANAKEGQER